MFLAAPEGGGGEPTMDLSVSPVSAPAWLDSVPARGDRTPPEVAFRDLSLASWLLEKVYGHQVVPRGPNLAFRFFGYAARVGGCK